MTADPLNVALVVADKMLRDEAIACVGNLPVHLASDQESLDDTEDLLDRIERNSIDVLLLEGRLLATPLAEFTRRLQLTSTEPAIFLLQKEAVAENILEAMKAGAREYLCPPLVLHLREAFERLSAVRMDQLSSRQKKLGRIYGFLSAKGGSGATTFASHVARAAARNADRPVLLADLDFEAGLLRFILKAKPRYSMRDAVDNMHRMDSSYWNALVFDAGNKLEFIAAPEELAERAVPDSRPLSRLLRFIRTQYPISIVDFGRWYSAAAIDSLPELETLFLLTTQDLLTLENAKEFLHLAEERGKGNSHIKVLLNRVSARQKPDLAAMERFLGARPNAVFSDDSEALYETWSEGRLLGEDAGLGRQLAALAKSMTEPEPEPETTQAVTVPAQAGLGRFFPFMRRSRA